MSELLLTLRQPLLSRLDASALPIDRLGSLSRQEIERFPLRFECGDAVPLGELFGVSGNASETIRIVGDLNEVDGLGAGMRTGALHIEGNAGRRVGAWMKGGSISVAGDAGDDMGSEMAGGRIVVRGDAGRRIGAAAAGAKRGMIGGEIVVFGSAGEQAGAFMRRGVIAVAGTLGADAAHAAIAGTVVALGNVAAPAGRWIKRASLVALSDVPISPTWPYACTYRPSFVRVLLTHLRREYGFPVTAEQIGGTYRRYCGDMAESARGEILHWTGR